MNSLSGGNSGRHPLPGAPEWPGSEAEPDVKFDLNLKQLKVFYYVAKYLSFTRAAQDLYVTQPAVAMQIDALEKHYDVQLFSRKKRRLALTEAGEALYEYAEKIMQLAYEAHRSLIDLKEYPTGILRVGTTKTWARFLMPSYILGFQRKYPEIQIDLEDGTSEEMAFSVLYGQNDMAVVARMAYDPRLESMPFPGHETDRLVAVMHPKHPLARRKKVALKELRDEPLLLRGKGSGIRELVLGMAKDQGIELSVLLEAGSADFIKAMVAQGAGVSVLTTIAVSEAVARGMVRAIPLSDQGTWLSIDIVMRKEGYRPVPVRLFTEYLKALSGSEGRALTSEPAAHPRGTIQAKRATGGTKGKASTDPSMDPVGVTRSAKT